ncbi:serine hydrolase [Chitinophaga sp. sic0106]|uniref:serine hydrolase domain-containing protein n=1 Tax=Chitinophaga sp. sic0106 TaxID=2854785 RepID=UPI001C489B45|nr:serine hydrolase domain-containing protein [Chitinophaga sp. sic0106]MBV7530508.1 beta-lactamase family protein [Chitinophaga sp. sic0106]
MKFHPIKTFLSICLLSLAANAQSTRDSLTQLLNQQYSQSGFVGFSVAIVNKDTLLYEHGFGHADLQRQTPYGTNTLQPIASVSKLFIGMAVMKALEQGLFTLDTPVNDLLPFKVALPNMADKPLLIKHLATHTSGITDNQDYYKKTYVYTPPVDVNNALYQQIMAKGYGATGADTTLGAFLKSYLAADGKFYSKKNFNKSAPGSRYDYSNIASDLAAYLIEMKSGLSFADYTEKYILGPLHMDHSGWFPTAPGATLYTGLKAPYPAYSSICYPDGGLITSGHELSLFLKENIAGHEGKGTLLSPASYKTMLQPAFSAAYTPKNIDPNEPNIGVFYIMKKNGIIGHSGGDGGVTSFLFFNPEKGFGMLFISNTELEGLNGVNKNLLADFQRIWSLMGQFGGKMQVEFGRVNN